MSDPRGSRFACLPIVPVSVVALFLLMLSTVMPDVARGDTKKFVSPSHGDAFDAAAAAAAQSASPTIARIRVREPGLPAVDNSLPNPVSEVWSDYSPATTRSVFPAPPNTSDETPNVNGVVAYEMGSNQANHDSTAFQWATNLYGGGGFYFYPDVPGLVEPSGQLSKGTGSDQIDLASGHSSEGDLNSADGPGTRHNGVVPKIEWPFRILIGQAVAVPEPSSLLTLGCGVFAVGLKRKYLSAK
jgi:hypothetical protein